MKLIDLYGELADPLGFDHGRSIPHGLYEAKNFIIRILNEGLENTPWEAYTIDQRSNDRNKTAYIIFFRVKNGRENEVDMTEPKEITRSHLRGMVIDILEAAEKDWEIHTTISVCRRN